MQGRQDPRARCAQQVTTSGPTGIGGAAAGVAAAARALAVVAEVVGAGLHLSPPPHQARGRWHEGPYGQSGQPR